MAMPLFVGMNGTTVAVGHGGPSFEQTKRKHVGCIECRRYLLRIVVCEYDAIICELLCKGSWYTLQFIHTILGLCCILLTLLS